MRKKHPELAYQLQNAGGEVDRVVGGASGGESVDKKKLRGWLNAMFGGVSKETGVMAFDPWKGLDLGRLESVEKSPLVGEEVMEFYGTFSLSFF